MSKVIIPPYSTIQYDEKTKQLNFYKNSKKVTYVMGDYTAFEVFAHDYDIPIGECEELNGEIYFEIPADMCHKFQIRSEDLPETQDVVVDWGDGTVEALSSFAVESISGSEGDWRYTLEHTYAANGKYIIKIYGKKYFAMITGNASTDPNILCRIFDEDLPVASHLTNFSSFCKRSNHLINVDVSKCNNFNKNYYNISNTFFNCKNLLSAIGFSSSNKINCEYGSIFDSCYSLRTCDLKLTNCTSLVKIFNKCYYINIDISNLFKYFNITDSVSISASLMFRSCGHITGIVPAHKLWNNKNITWTDTSEAFLGSNKDIRAQVPVSWGGTNQSIDEELRLNKLIKDNNIDLDYYSSFEVMPNKTVISAGTLDDVTGLNYGFEIPANTIHKMTIRSAQEPENCDVVIDWGDGTVDSIKEGNYISHSTGKSYELSHDYSSKMTSDKQKFIVKIYGKNYYTFRYNSYPDNNLTSRIFDADLPIAPHITNFASMCYCAIRLLKVVFPHSTAPFPNVYNWTSCLAYCKNLVSADGFGSISIKDGAIINWLFNHCYSLTTTDFKFPEGSTSLNGVFYGCVKLNNKIEDLFPASGFSSNKVYLNTTFTDTLELEGTIPDNLLWNDDQVKWIIEAKTTSTGGSILPFTGSSLAASAPKSWGGTASDDIIVKQFWTGTQEEYDALTVIHDETFYIIKES